jgi:hypothetical protein
MTAFWVGKLFAIALGGLVLWLALWLQTTKFGYAMPRTAGRIFLVALVLFIVAVMYLP